jgi:hypothetical protein
MFNPDKPYFTLVDGKIKQVSTEEYMTWIMVDGKEKVSRVSYTDLKTEEFAAYEGGDYVSTVFLGIDHNHFGDGPPILFETMIFGGSADELQWRYRTLEQAQAGHQMIVQSLRAGLEPEYSRSDPSWVDEFFKQYTGE